MTPSAAALERHVGFYLVDRGRRTLERHLGLRPARWPNACDAASTRRRCRSTWACWRCCTLAFAEPLVAAAVHDALPLPVVIALAIAAAILASQLACACSTGWRR